MKLEPNTNVGGFGWNIQPPLPPPGQYVGICLDIKDEFAVDRKAFQSDQMEKRDVTRFLFGLRQPQTRQLFLVQTFEFNISGAPNSNLVQFIRGWTNADPYGFDYMTLKGSGALLTIGHKHSVRNPSVIYAVISGCTPVYPTLQGEIPTAQEFASLVAQANQPRPIQTTTTVPGATAATMLPGVGSAVRKFWTQGSNGQVVLATEAQIIQKGEPHRMVMAENQQGGWVTASSVITFIPPAVSAPATAPMPPPVAPPPPFVPFTPPAPPANFFPAAPEEDEIPF